MEPSTKTSVTPAELIEAAKELYPETVRIRRHLHSHPELSEHEENTSRFVRSILDEHGISYTSGVAGFGIVAQVGDVKDGCRCIAVRADMDALPVCEATGLEYASENPGVMHACGHDMHTAILLSTGILLKKLDDEGRLNGAVKLFFQPAEETVGGASPMIEAGFLKNPDVSAVTALHVDPEYPAGTIVLKYGPMNAATGSFTLTVRGKSCHGAHPDAGIDTIVVSAQVITAVQSISSRFMAPTTPVVVTIGSISGGTAGNIIAGEVVMRGTIRALDMDTMAKAKNLFVQIAKNTASAYGASAEVQWADDYYPALINDDDVTRAVEETTDEYLGHDMVRHMPEPSLGADDFAFFTQSVKGTYFNLGVTKEGDPVYSLHNEHFAPAEEAMLNGVIIQTASALKLLEK